MPKPAFDPSKAYEEIDAERNKKPAFNETMPYEPASQIKAEASQPLDIQNVTPKKEPTVWEGIKDFARNFDSQRMVEGLSEGPPLYESVPIVGPAVKNATLMGIAGVRSLGSDKGPGELYDEMQAQERREAEQYHSQYPESSFVKSLAGGAIFPIGGLSKALVKGPGLASQFGRAAGMASEAATIAGTDALIRGSSEGEALDTSEEALKWGAILGGAPVAAKTLGTGFAAGWAGIKPSNIPKYRSGRERINSLDPERIVDDLGGDAEKLRQSSILGKEDAKLKYEKRMDRSRLSRKEALMKIRDKIKKEQSDDIASADLMQRDAAEGINEKLKEARKQISEGSSRAIETLKDDQMIPLSPYKGRLTAAINRNKIGEASLGTADTQILEKYRGFLDEINKEDVSPREMRLLIRKLDSDLEAAYAQSQTAGGYNPPGVRTLMAMRSFVSSRLKRDFPEYKEAMEPLAEKTRTLSQFQKKFPSSGPDEIYSRLSGIDSPSKLDRSRALQAFESQFGGDFSKKMQDVSSLRNKDYLSKEASEKAFIEAKNIEKRRAIERNLRQKNKDLSNQAKTAGSISKDNAYQTLLRYGNDPEKNFELGRRLESIAEKSERNPSYYKDMADDLSVKRNFETAYSQGSKRVNLGAFSATGLMKLLGVSADRALGGGEFFGALGGAMGDTLGPKTVKFIIDSFDSPMGERLRKVYRSAAERGPQAMAVTHNMLLQRDPEYKAAFDFYNFQGGE